jgi:Flp pilus assembly protein TadB
MAPKQRPMKVEQRSALAAMAQLETRSDEELIAETRQRAAAQAILGARAAERYDSQRAREHFRKAIAASRPQERMQLRRMAEASLAMAERRPDDLKSAMEKLGQQAPTGRQLFMLRLMGLLSPSPGAGVATRLRAVALMLLIVFVLLAVGWGRVGFWGALVLGLLVVIAALAVLSLVGRRRQRRAQAQATEARVQRATR